MADTAVKTRPIKMEEMMAVFKHVEDTLTQQYAGKPLPPEQERMKLIQDEVEKATGVRPAPGSPPMAVASTHEASVAKILEEQKAKHGGMKAPELGIPDMSKPLPTPPKPPADKGKGI